MANIPTPPKGTKFVFETHGESIICYIVPDGDVVGTILGSATAETYSDASWRAKTDYEGRRMGRRPFVR